LYLMNTLCPPAEMLLLLRLAQDAGREIMRVYASDFAVATKADLSPVTEADAMAEKIILAGLAKHWPEIPVLAEESAAAGQVPELGEAFFLVDPLDGTKEFLSRNGEFTVNIARIYRGKAVSGVVYAPATRQIYWGQAGTGAAFGQLSPEESLGDVAWQSISVRCAPADGLTVVASRSHMDAATAEYLATRKVKSLSSAGSSLKFCLVASGLADLYPRFGRTMEWDTAAGQAVLEAAGGKVVNLDLTPLIYGKADRGFDNPAFIASS
jgi:3'(2'), 5'-bisphosphate nucleotidase